MTTALLFTGAGVFYGAVGLLLSRPLYGAVRADAIDRWFMYSSDVYLIAPDRTRPLALTRVEAYETRGVYKQKAVAVTVLAAVLWVPVLLVWGLVRAVSPAARAYFGRPHPKSRTELEAERTAQAARITELEEELL